MLLLLLVEARAVEVMKKKVGRRMNMHVLSYEEVTTSILMRQVAHTPVLDAANW